MQYDTCLHRLALTPAYAKYQVQMQMYGFMSRSFIGFNKWRSIIGTIL